MHLLKILLSWHAVAPNYTSIWGQDLSAAKALICFAMAEPLNSQDLSSNSPYFYHAVLVHVMLVWKIWYWINL